jgi:hypothetical protein
VEVGSIPIADRAETFLEVPAPCEPPRVGGRSTRKYVEGAPLKLNRGKPFVKPKGSIEATSVCSTAVSPDVVPPSTRANSGKSRIVE